MVCELVHGLTITYRVEFDHFKKKIFSIKCLAHCDTEIKSNLAKVGKGRGWDKFSSKQTLTLYINIWHVITFIVSYGVGSTKVVRLARINGMTLIRYDM